MGRLQDTASRADLRFQERKAELAANLHMEWVETYRMTLGCPTTNGAANRREVTTFATGSNLLVDNQMLQAFRAAHAMMVRGRPEPKVALVRSSQTAAYESRCSERFLRYAYLKKSGQTAYADACAWAIITGTGYLGAVWNLTAGKPLRVPVYDESGAVKYKKEWVPVKVDGGETLTARTTAYTPVMVQMDVPATKVTWPGDLRFVSINPFDVVHDDVAEWDNVPWVAIRHVMPIEEFRKRFPEDKAATVESLNLLDLNTPYGIDNTTSHARKMVEVILYYEKPTPQWPDGFYGVLSNKKFIMHADHLPGGMLPVCPIVDTVWPGTVYGACSLAQAKGTQRSLTRHQTDMDTNQRTMARPILCVPQELASNKSGELRTIQDFPGRVLPVSGRQGATPPMYVSPPSLPEWVSRRGQELMMTIERVTGVNAPSLGSGQGTESGRQALILIERDREKWFPAAERAARAWEHVAELALRLWAEMGPLEETVSVIGPANSLSGVEVFKRAWLSGPDTTIRVMVEASNLNPFPLAARQSQVMDMFQQGAIPDRRIFARLMNDPDLAEALGDDSLTLERFDVVRVDFLERGKVPPVFPHENLPLIKDLLVNAMRHADWYGYEQPVQEAYAQYLALIEQQLMQRMMAQQAAASQNATGPSHVATGQLQSRNGGASLPGSGGPRLPPELNGAARSNPGVPR